MSAAVGQVRSAGREPHAPPCLVCGRGARRLYDSPVSDATFARCGGCGLAFAVEPPVRAGGDAFEETQPDWDDYVSDQRPDDDARRIEVLERLRAMAGTGGDRQPVLFDVGAGSGDFLVLAATRGFDVRGNDLSRRAIEHARARHGLLLSPLLLEDQPAESVDVVTMWCVLAHVADPEAFLGAALAMLRPGGAIFLRTPRWCAIDDVGLLGTRIGRGQVSTLTRRRLNEEHQFLFNASNLTRMLERAGFRGVTAAPACHYPFNSRYYAATTGRTSRSVAIAGRVADRLIARRAFVRNTLFAYASKPS